MEPYMREALRLWLRGARIPEVIEVLELFRGELVTRHVTSTAWRGSRAGTVGGRGSSSGPGRRPRGGVTMDLWDGKPWAQAATEANTGMRGQGYIVHAVMTANRYGRPLAITVIALMVVQIVVGIWQIICR